MTISVRYNGSERSAASSGLYAERIAGNSPQNPASPGRPRLAIAQKPRIHPSRGIWINIPERRLISSVW